MSDSDSDKQIEEKVEKQDEDIEGQIGAFNAYIDPEAHNGVEFDSDPFGTDSEESKAKDSNENPQISLQL